MSKGEGEAASSGAEIPRLIELPAVDADSMVDLPGADPQEGTDTQPQDTPPEGSTPYEYGALPESVGQRVEQELQGIDVRLAQLFPDGPQEIDAVRSVRVPMSGKGQGWAADVTVTVRIRRV